jgi:tRNA(adenine34) deaminase
MAVPLEEHWMNEALAEAALATEHADVPVGCVIVSEGGEELARAHNRREVDGDPTAHAELLALRAAAQKIGHWRLERCLVVVTLEPCAMCAGALVNARVGRLIFGTHDPKAGAVQSLFQIGNDPRLNHRFQAESGLFRERSIALLQAFFGKLRAAGER